MNVFVSTSMTDFRFLAFNNTSLPLFLFFPTTLDISVAVGW